jgi:DNA primase
MSARRTDGDDEPRYKIEYAFEKSRVLYNLCTARRTESDQVIIVEGFKAAWAVHEAGFPCVVACMGSVITDDQVSLLVSSRFMKCVLMFDGDKAGRDGMAISLPKLERALRVLPAYLPDGISPDSISREELRDFLNIHVC